MGILNYLKLKKLYVTLNGIQSPCKWDGSKWDFLVSQNLKIYVILDGIQSRGRSIRDSTTWFCGSKDLKPNKIVLKSLYQ